MKWLFAACVVLFAVDMSVGSAAVPLAEVWRAFWGGASEMHAAVVLDIRLLRACTAVLAGASLAVAGLLMQTLFRNPLSGPYVLGISSGASLGVALVLLTGVSWSLGVVGAAWIGAAAVLSVVAALGRRIGDVMVILVLGILFSSGMGALVQILQYLSPEAALKNFVIWTMGSLSDVTAPQMALFAPAIALGLILSVVAAKPLDLLLLGEDYARTSGVRLGRARGVVFGAVTLLAGTVTAFCGPIGFVGLAAPHLGRILFRTASHRRLLPASVGVGVAMMLVCDLASKLLALPVNAISALLGIPIVVWVVVRYKNLSRC